MADPVFESISNTTYATRTNTTVTAPAGITNGDTLIYAIFVLHSTGYQTATPPAGFVLPSGGTWPIQITDGVYETNVYVWYKIASGESGDYEATHGSCSTQGVMLRISSGDGAQPASTTNNGTAADTTATGLSTAANGALVAVIAWDWGETTNNLTGPAGTTPTFTERLDVALTGAWTGNLAAAGATGNKTFANNSTTGPWAAAMLAIEPSTSGPGSGSDTSRVAMTESTANLVMVSIIEETS